MRGLRIAIVVLAFVVLARAQNTAEKMQSVRESAPPDCSQIASTPEHADAIEAFCNWVLTFRSRLPDILSDEQMKRMQTDARGYWERLDAVSMKVHYDEGKVDYADILLNGRATRKTIYELDGSWSTGELGATLEGLLFDVEKSKFKFTRQTSVDSRRVLEFTFSVTRAENTSWALLTTGNRQTVPGYRGHIWLDETTFQLVEFNRASTDVNRKFPIRSVTTVTKYKKIQLADNSDFVLPVSSESVSCMERQGDCLRNVLTFENWRKFGAEHRIISDTPAEQK